MSTKHFLYTLFGSATVIWIAIFMAFGPAGLSAEYTEKYGAEHDHYLELIKSDAVKAYYERPALHGADAPGAPANLEEQIAFIESYESRPEFHAEEARRARFNYLFEFFNAGVVLALIVVLAKGPLTRFLDEGRQDVSERIEHVHARRIDAEARLAEAEKQIEHLPEEERRLGEETEHRLWNELAELEKANQHSLNEMVKAMEDRKQAEVVAAQGRMKLELLNAGIKTFVKNYEAGASATTQDALVEHFAEKVRGIKG